MHKKGFVTTPIAEFGYLKRPDVVVEVARICTRGARGSLQLLPPPHLLCI